jgi:acyl-coenzyme A synthetase/AMP-(fatty) acid ligase
MWDNLSDPVFHHARVRPDAPALIDGPTVLSYRQLADWVGRASVHLDGLGIGRGDRVGVSLPSGADHVILVLALLRIGATLVELHHEAATPLDPALSERFGIARIFLEPGAAAPRSVAVLRIDAAWRETVARQSGDHRTNAKADALQLLSMSSGSTGVPKGVVTTQALIFARNRVFDATMGAAVHTPDRPANFLVTASIAYMPFLRRLLAQFAAGGPAVLLPEYARALDLVAAIAGWDNAALGATANMCRAFIAAAPADGLLFPRVRALCSLGMPLYPEEKRAIVRRVTPHFYDSYGTSGVGMIACLLPADVEAKAASVGRAVPGIEIEIVDRAGARCAPGAIGRLRCRGQTSATEFLELGEPGEHERFAEGWYYPGEIGALDEDGFLFLKGRAAELIRRAGVEIFPAEIEEAIASHPGVRAVAVVGLPSAALGEELVAVVVANGPPSHADLAQHCRQMLAPGKWPDRVFYAAALPVTSGGKPDRAQLRTLVLQQIAQQPQGPR